MAKLITLGTLTSTGGKIITASSNMTINGKKVVKLGDIGTCPCGKKSCRGQGKIYRKGVRKITIDGTELAKGGDPIDTGCGTCFVSDPIDMVCVGDLNQGGIVIGGNGAGVSFGDGVFMLDSDNSPLVQSSQARNVSSTSSLKSSVVGSQVNAPYSSEPLLYSQTQTVEKVLSDSLALECSLEEEMAKNMQHVLITDLEDAHKILHNVWLDSGKDVAALAASINTAKSWFNHTEPMFDAASIAKQFGDMNIKADLVESKGKIFVAFNGTDQNGKVLKHAFVNGTNINMDGKKYPLNSFKSMQAGFSPKSRAANFKGAGILTFVVSASIATSDLVFKDDYHLVDWFGNVGSDMFKALVQFGAGEAILWGVVAASGYVLVGAIAVAVTYGIIEWAWGEYNIANSIVEVLEDAVEN